MILTEDDIARELAALSLIDPRLAALVEIAGPLPVRATPGGLRGLIGMVVGQQVSRASAVAILTRLGAAMDLDDPRSILAATDADFRFAGMSRVKERTALALAEACLDGRLDFARITELSPDAAIGELIALPGIGPWTAECFLLFSAGHPDIFPAGDLALQIAVAHGLGLAERPKPKPLVALARDWAPHRSAAARLFWGYYAVLTRRDAAPVDAATGAQNRRGDDLPAAENEAARAGATPAVAKRSRRLPQGFTKATR
ncbi:DNA-3-methyladenine glycosidase [Aureimonas sp. SA4125]|uniref:DNA-3-methyladenine glycosylase family protein n=1 Tax=Aureimonas sp. SA4125 TaxID=2826993 RepID=UPI001CC47993|nr:DNA-3-methyladenine glycosylase 2 family protein [Aureimonas sp. SA4125]BDA86163.1 DNA-3-methyladenine glycosidase [Aureimonas sp. SA4125]